MAPSIPVLYHAESSFYSQRARLAFAEKGVRYKSHLISLLTGEMHAPWYLQSVNPKGTVPALEHMGRNFNDSKDIIEYVDTLPSDRPKLCPEGQSHDAEQVRYFRDQLNALNIPVITFGAVYHRDSLTTNSMVPGFMTQARTDAMLTKGSEDFGKLPERDRANRRNPSEFGEMVKDTVAVLKCIDECDKMLEEVEEALRKRKSEYGDDEYWLCSKTFTIADIFLSCVLHRLTFVGLSQQLFLSGRPLTSDYYHRVTKRRSFQRECAYANSNLWAIFIPLMRAQVKRALPGIGFACFAAVGAYAYYRRDDIWKFVIDVVENRMTIKSITVALSSSEVAS